MHSVAGSLVYKLIDVMFDFFIHVEHLPSHDDVIKWKHLPHYWPFVRGIHQSPVNSLHKGQWRGNSMFSLIWEWKNGLVNNCESGDLRRPSWRYCNACIVGFIGYSKHHVSNLEFSFQVHLATSINNRTRAVVPFRYSKTSELFIFDNIIN